MIACLCKGLSDRDIDEQIDKGAETVEAISKACGAGTDCGGCRGHLRSLLDGRPFANHQPLLLPLAAK